MKFLNKTQTSRVWLFRSALFVILPFLPVIHSEGQTISSTSSASSLQIVLNGAGAGLSDWQYAGGSQLAQQWFYYSIGSSSVNSIDQISTAGSVSSSANSLSATYSSNTISVQTTFLLNNPATLSDTLTIANPTGSGQTVTFHFYQFSEFSLGGTTSGQNVVLSYNGISAIANQTGPGNVSLHDQSGGSSAPTPEQQAGLATMFGLVNGNTATNLNNTTLTAGPGNAVYALEWDKTLAPGQSFQISEIQTLTATPEPSSIVLGVCGTVALIYGYRRNKRNNGN